MTLSTISADVNKQYITESILQPFTKEAGNCGVFVGLYFRIGYTFNSNEGIGSREQIGNGTISCGRGYLNKTIIQNSIRRLHAENPVYFWML